MKRLLKPLLALVALLLVYLAVVAWWASASVDTLLAQYPAKPSLPHLSHSQRAILLAIEDPTFLSHHGLSLANGQGVATISSAVARETFLDGATLDGAAGQLQGLYRGVYACCKRVDFGRDVMALVLDAKVSKERQLAIYAATVYMGRQDGKQVRGLEGAAQAYLGKPLAALGDDEMAALVAMIRAPNELHPLRNHEAYELRLLRVRAVLSGRCKPAGWFDTTYAHCAP
ncbi:transglycosylase domain-containing protein [Massilia sp. Dwa41.01b]|uniref:transglycosylase domain-containing protein n=1 Tax=unclassified Massilia TaxID=2609279 RepID=UPI0015FFBF79|nr:MULTISPECIES: transglycosylase domain-containing protein [unclassified Massilia]QNA90657.1 transglycosylase domain-containing protein [Massilia sp. Dwa41.01b]QNA97888.1 transglycosylase domain-containing protein [Massilia sp. Se16.2.3]